MDTIVERFENTADLEASIFERVKFTKRKAITEDRIPK